jgi:imidazolonepropionase-like amidohydrolase
VTVHAYTPAAVRQAVIAGVRCVEHGQLLDDATAELMAERGVWWSVQPFCDDEDAIPMGSPVTRAKQLLVMEGTDRAFALAAKHGVRLAWGTDTLFDAGLAARQGAQLVKTARWMPAADVIRLATVGNGRLLAESGPRNPYPRPVGVVEPGAYADWLLVDGDPVTDLGLLADPDRFIVVKDGLVVPRH